MSTKYGNYKDRVCVDCKKQRATVRFDGHNGPILAQHGVIFFCSKCWISRDNKHTQGLDQEPVGFKSTPKERKNTLLEL